MGSAAAVSCAPEPAPAHARSAVSGWRAPVGGELVRGFDAGRDPFSGGAHRGIDLSARPGARVGATCAGRVAFAGPVARLRVVTVTCGSWRVTHLPLAELAVAAGDAVRTGQKLGTVAASTDHAGLHLGVRRAGNRFGYVDPWSLLDRSAGDPGEPGTVPARRWRPAGRARVPRARRGPRAATRPRGDVSAPVAVPRVVSAPAPAAHRPSAGDQTVAGRLAPPLAWLGLALLLGGVARTRSRRVTHSIRLRAKEPATRGR